MPTFLRHVHKNEYTNHQLLSAQSQYSLFPITLSGPTRNYGSVSRLDVALPLLNIQTSNSKSYISELSQPSIFTVSVDIPMDEIIPSCSEIASSPTPTTPGHLPKLQNETNRDSLSLKSQDSIFSEYSRRKGSM